MTTFLEELAVWTRVPLACRPDDDFFHLATSENCVVCGAWEADASSDITSGVLADVECPECLNLVSQLTDVMSKADLWSKKIGMVDDRYPGLSEALLKTEQKIGKKYRGLSSPQFALEA